MGVETTDRASRDQGVMVDEPESGVLPHFGAWRGTERQMGGLVLGRRNGDGMKPTKAYAVLGDRVCMTIPGMPGSKLLRQLRRPVSVRVELSRARHPSKRSQIGTPGTRPVRANGT